MATELPVRGLPDLFVYTHTGKATQENQSEQTETTNRHYLITLMQNVTYLGVGTGRFIGHPLNAAGHVSGMQGPHCDP